LNGVDHAVWDPRTDPHLPATGGANYSVADLSGKRACKRALFERVGFPASRVHRPLFGCISRLVNQKGIDLICQALPDLVRRDAYIVVLGSGPEQQALESAMQPHRHHCAIAHGYDEPLAHLIEAGSDFYLMPSRYEPCGLNQMYSQVYGTLPIVRRTGGLADTVIDLTDDRARGTGFAFGPYDRDALLGAIGRALNLWDHERSINRIRQRAMMGDFSWDRAAAAYAGIYEQLVRNRRRANRTA
ncbi:MAG: glycogen synthase, partial [Planctomycetota bacterium]